MKNSKDLILWKTAPQKIAKFAPCSTTQMKNEEFSALNTKSHLWSTWSVGVVSKKTVPGSLASTTQARPNFYTAPYIKNNQWSILLVPNAWRMAAKLFQILTTPDKPKENIAQNTKKKKWQTLRKNVLKKIAGRYQPAITREKNNDCTAANTSYLEWPTWQ